MPRDRSQRIMIILVILAIVLSVSFAILLVKQEMERRRSGIEFQVYQIMTGLVDAFNAGESFNPAEWPEISGFGMYTASGEPLYCFGTAPLNLEGHASISARGISELSASSMVIIRRIGALPPMLHPDGPFRGMGRMMNGGMMGMGRKGRLSEGRPNPRSSREANPSLPAERLPRFVFIDLEVGTLVREGRLVLFAVIALLSVFVGIVSLVLVYSRKLAGYREREQQTAHLVQLGEAARTLAHEIKNPLGVIRVQCATLKRSLPEERLKNISVIEEETERLVLLTDRVRDFLRNSEGDPRIQDADAFLSRCGFRYTGRIAVLPYEGQSVHIRIDVDRMMQVLDNLIVNALESLETAVPGDAPERSVRPALPEVSMTVRKGLVSFCVADRGAGVSPENRSRLFEPFFTTKARGSGIGLALARRFIEQAGGSLTYDDRPGGGSRFTATLPAVSEEYRQ